MSGLSCQYVAAAEQFAANAEKLAGDIRRTVIQAKALEGELGRELEERDPDEFRKLTEFVEKRCHRLLVLARSWDEEVGGELARWIALAAEGGWEGAAGRATIAPTSQL